MQNQRSSATQAVSSAFVSAALRLFGAATLTTTALLSLAGCAAGDVGAPCNHGRVDPPDSRLVTFPALSCDDLICIYGDDAEPRGGDCNPTTAEGDAQCNDDPMIRRFECAPSPGDPSTGVCRLRADYVLERSMCSRRCESDADCRDGGVGEDVVVDDNACALGFECARIQRLGEFCCAKLCVCSDDLGTQQDELDEECLEGSVQGCCQNMDGSAVDPLPEGCFTP